ncbi:kinase-like domain-containing protein [Xylaria cf. heliscus]|nr:kinase-like domain-containing protein [Xylaria cf. heliscus]
MDYPETEDRDSTPEELPRYARVEDIEQYVVGGFHPIHVGDRIGPAERFEVHHKLGYSKACTVWLCFDRKNGRRVAVKVLQAEKSIEPHPEIEALRLFEGIDREELQSNGISTMDEHFWIDGPNGRHLCFVMQVFGPDISYSLKGVDLDTPDLLTDLCLQAAQILKYLHDKKICHGDFRPNHMRLQLDVDAMSDGRIYDLFGEPTIWHLNGSREESDRKPRYLVEPANIANLEEKYRTGKIVLNSFATSYREGDAIEPQISDSDYTPPEIRFSKTSCGFGSDIWSLGSTIHLVRTNKLLLATLDSKSSIVSWLAWAYGPFPKDCWQAVGDYLSHDSAIPVFSVNIVPQKSPIRRTDVDSNGYPREWGQSRWGIVALFLGEEDTPRSIRERKMLQDEKDRSKYLRIRLPKNSDVWAKFQDQRQRRTGFASLLHEDLSRERQWYQDTDALNGRAEDTREVLPSRIDDATLRRLNGTWVPGSAAAPATEDPHPDHETSTHEENKDTAESTNSNGKRPLTGEDQEGQPNSKKARTFIAEHNLRDQVECVEQYDGMTKFSYRLQPAEVDLLASLLRGMLKNDPDERISIDEVLRHEWFEASRKRLEGV